MKIIIKGRYPDMNKIINADRAHWAIGAKLKKLATAQMALQIPNRTLSTPIFIDYDFYIPLSCRLDPDNIFGGFQKAFLDALQKKGLLRNDSKKEILGFSAAFHEAVDNDYTTIINIEES